MFIDFLAERLPPLIEASRLDCINCEERRKATAENIQRAKQRAVAAATK